MGLGVDNNSSITRNYFSEVFNMFWFLSFLQVLVEFDNNTLKNQKPCLPFPNQGVFVLILCLKLLSIDI